MSLFPQFPAASSPPDAAPPIQALSIEPINGYVLELLDIALEASADLGPFGFKSGPKGEPPGGEELWEQKMREHRDKGKQVAKPSPSDFEDTSL